MEPKLEVWPNPDGGFYVVEVDYRDSLGNRYDMPRGWTYPTREMAEKAIPFVAKGIFYPTDRQLNDEINLTDPKVNRRVVMLGEDVARQLHVAEIGASNEVENLIAIIDNLADKLYQFGAPAKLRVSE